MSQDTNSELENIVTDESLDTPDSEGVTAPEDQQDEETTPEDHDDIFNEETEKISQEADRKQKAKDKAREGIVGKAYEKLLTGEIESTDDIDQEWVRKAVDDRLAEDVESDDEVSSKIGALENEISEMKDKTQLERSRKVFEDSIADHGISKEEFKERYWSKYAKRVNQLREEGVSKVRSTEIALETLDLGGHDDLLEAEQRGNISDGISMPKSTGTRIDSEKGFNRREFAETNASLASIGSEPLSKEAYLDAKKSGIF